MRDVLVKHLGASKHAAATALARPKPYQEAMPAGSAPPPP